MSAAIAAARNGVRTVLMHDRPVLGGNASSEIRMWICGARGAHCRETGIIEEILLENRRRNPSSSYALWDALLYGKAAFQENLHLLLNCSCMQARMKGTRIAAVEGWQLTTETRHEVTADVFLDCSGDSILAPLSGADFRIGREARAEYGESIAPLEADDRTMGMSCLLQARETDRPQPFLPPDWAYRFPTEEHLDNARRDHDIHQWSTNFWWIEIGGEADSVHDAETNRDELLKIAYGVWDHIKNHGDHGAENWMLEWVGFLPGKRESRRYIGDHVLTQNDVRAGGPFPDVIAYGGWPMDDHPPGGFRHAGHPTVWHPAPSPFGIPYRCLYSRTIDNLLFAGRNLSATHAALSSTRVMATCAVLGQAAGTAAALAATRGITPRELGAAHIEDLQQTLLWDDSYLPGMPRHIDPNWRHAALEASAGDPEPLRSGVDRPVGDLAHAWEAPVGAHVTVRFEEPVPIRELRLVFDSDLSPAAKNMPAQRPLDYRAPGMPATLVRAFHVDALDATGGWVRMAQGEDNARRCLVLPGNNRVTQALRLTLDASWGDNPVRVFAFDGRT